MQTSLPSGMLDRQVLEVVGPRFDDGQTLAVTCAPLRRNGNLLSAGEVLPGERLCAGEDGLERAFGDDAAPEFARARAQIDDPIRLADGLVVVLHDQHRVAEVAQALESIEQPRVVAGVQPDGGLIENVENANEPRAHLRGQTDALRFAAGKRAGRAVERQVVQAHVDQETQGESGFP